MLFYLSLTDGWRRVLGDIQRHGNSRIIKLLTHTTKKKDHRLDCDVCRAGGEKSREVEVYPLKKRNELQLKQDSTLPGQDRSEQVKCQEAIKDYLKK